MTIGETFNWNGKPVTILDVERDPNGIAAVCVRVGSRGKARWLTSDAAIDDLLQARAKSLTAVLL